MIDEMNELDEYERSLNSADGQYEEDGRANVKHNQDSLYKERQKPLLERQNLIDHSSLLH